MAAFVTVIWLCCALSAARESASKSVGGFKRLGASSLTVLHCRMKEITGKERRGCLLYVTCILRSSTIGGKGRETKTDWFFPNNKRLFTGGRKYKLRGEGGKTNRIEFCTSKSKSVCKGQWSFTLQVLRWEKIYLDSERNIGVENGKETGKLHEKPETNRLWSGPFAPSSTD